MAHAKSVVDAAVAAYEEGASTVEIESRFGVGSGPLYYHLRRRGVTDQTARRKRSRLRRLPPDTIDAIVLAYEAGASIRAVARKFGTSLSTVEYHLKKRGIARRQQSWRGCRGPDHPKWRGGRSVHPDGYVMTNIAHTGHPWPRKSDSLFEHIRVMELAIGRRLKRDECVHHVDGDPANNTLENLRLMKRSDHTRLHHDQGDIHRRSH